MSDFVNAFKMGQDAAEKARAARESIKALVGRVSDELSAATDGRLTIAVRVFDDHEENENRSLFDVIGKLPRIIRTSYLAAANPKAKDSNYRRLAKWILGEKGFPCRIAFGKTELTCHDIEALAAAMEEALSSADVGEKLAAVLALSESTA